MRAVLQRVSSASVVVDGSTIGAVGPGFLVLIGVAPSDTEVQIQWMVDKVVGLRVFSDDEGKMNLSLQDRGCAALVVSQFTLYADCRKGRRPSFLDAAPPHLAEPLYERFCEALADRGVNVQRGKFGAHMDVSLVNVGPVTIVLDSPEMR